MAHSTTLEPAAADAAAEPPAADRPPAPRVPGELEIRRRVERLFARELADPSEELVRFVRGRLEVSLDDAAAEEHVAELCRRALREMGRERQGAAAPAWRALERRRLDRRRFERALPGYYLG